MKHLLLPALLLGGPALATPGNVAGTNCPLAITVQSRDCTVTEIRRCEGAPLGAHTFLTYDIDGLLSSGVSSAEGEWVETFTNWDNSYEAQEGVAADPVSLDALLRDGIDTYDFRMTHTEGGKTRVLRVIGADVLTDREVTINGVLLKVATNDLRILEADGTVFYQTRGTQYVSTDMRVWFLGIDSVVGTDGSITNYDSTPVDFAFPGEPGFGNVTPRYGCEPAPEHGVDTAPFKTGPGVNTNK